jgi:hypothetical protein
MDPHKKEFYDLLEMSLTDGIITASERNVLINKAVSLGIDPAEANLIIDAAQQKADQEVDAAARLQRGKECPFCGGAIPQLADKCPHCGGTITVEASEELIQIIDKLEDALINMKSNDDIRKSKAEVEKYIRRANLYYESNPKVQKLLAEIAAETAEAEKKAKASARNKNIMSALKSIGSFLMSHKILSAVILLFILGGLVTLCESDEPISWSSTDKWDQNRQIASEEVAELSDDIDDLIDDGDLKAAARKLEKLTFLDLGGTSYIVSTYDAVFLKVIRAYVENNELSKAESLALVYKSKIDNDLSWEDSSCYIYLKAKYKETNRDFTILKSTFDYE